MEEYQKLQSDMGKIQSGDFYNSHYEILKSSIPKVPASIDTSGWEDNIALFKLEDIVYIKSVPGGSPSNEWPAINSKYEVDCKIIEVFKTPWFNGENISIEEKKLNIFQYEIISGKGKRIEQVGEKYLIPAKDKYLFKKDKFKTLLEDTELAPEGSVFILKDEYYSDDKHGVYIHSDRMKEFDHLFK